MTHAQISLTLAVTGIVPTGLKKLNKKKVLKQLSYKVNKKNQNNKNKDKIKQFILQKIN